MPSSLPRPKVWTHRRWVSEHAFDRVAVRSERGFYAPKMGSVRDRHCLCGRGAMVWHPLCGLGSRVVMSDESPRGRPLRLDEDAASADPDLAAFLSRPEGAPVYHGFPVLDEVEVDGFRLGMITDFLTEPDTAGDAFVVAPDGTRAGLVWEAEIESAYFHEVLASESGRWGVWAVGLPLPMTDVSEARSFLAELVPRLRREWMRWLAETAGEGPIS